ncbi:tetratricopeptide repeat protein [Allosphingosinicella vermicomposti]|uniref:tetratricopeptide repeat protein n=1 Tax=Allosphingosinicella vermicomposti TaxID=614671 RepID=UPI000D0F3CD5|nr:SPOR domain-containing protein [Allosphingosinicella vermicomposti]
MTSSMTMLRLGGGALLASLLTSGAAAQVQSGNGGSPSYQMGSAPRPEDPAVALSRYVRELSSNPQSLVALKGAGAAALRLGDAEAAGGFFARAEQISPRDGEVKTGIASVLALLGQPGNALLMFGEALTLGVPEQEMAAYRGLAYDLQGNQAAAQNDYALAIRTHRDVPEVERRLALSQAIGGDKAKALATIEGQLRMQDKAAWRTRAFILALTGDIGGATQAVQVALPTQAPAFAPFLAKLPTLTPAEKAAAVHLGQMPVTFQNLQGTQTIQVAQAPAPVRVQAVAVTPEPTAAQVTRKAKERTIAPQTKPVRQQAVAASAPPPVAQPVAVTAQVLPVQPEPAAIQFADIAALVQDLPAAAPVVTPNPPAPARQAAKEEPKPKQEVAKKAPVKKTETKKAEAKKPDPAKAHPSRAWVQLASGSNENALPGEYKKIKAKATKTLSAKSAWMVKNGASNRLLVGPFKTSKEAQAFVNDLAKDKVSGFAWTSTAGQEITKLPMK